MTAGLLRRGTAWGACLKVVLSGALSIKARKKYFPQQWLRVFWESHTTLLVCSEIWGTTVGTYVIWGTTVGTYVIWPGRERTNYTAHKSRLFFWLEGERRGPKESLFEFF
jgi:hypothetical protein